VLVGEEAQPARRQDGLVDVGSQQLKKEELAILPDRECRADSVASRLVEQPQQAGEEPVGVGGR
jgi:hypothetical protein